MLTLGWSSLFFFLLSTSLQSTLAAKFRVNTDKNRIVDSAGRERIFHGQNVVMKTAPFIPITDHFDARLKSWRISVNVGPKYLIG